MTRAVPNTFGSVTTAQTTNLDADFSAITPCSILPCTVGGSSTAITLTPVSSTLTVTAYTDKEFYSFVATSTANGPVTINISSVGASNLYMPDNATQASTNNIINGRLYEIAYNAGIPGFVIVSDLTPDHALDFLSTTQGAVLYRGANAWAALAPGTSGQVLQTNGANSNPNWQTLATSSTYVVTGPTLTILTSGSGTYTAPAGVVWAMVQLVGGGGGGGNTGAGGNGNATTFGTAFLSAGGGTGGSPGAAGAPGSAAGGIASGGDINMTGNASSNGLSGPIGQAGAPSVLGGGGPAAAAAGTNSGAGGGSGATGGQTYGGAPGASGGYVKKLIASPTSYSYAVGAGGTAGAGGGTGAGGSGIIIIEEHYNH